VTACGVGQERVGGRPQRTLLQKFGHHALSDGLSSSLDNEAAGGRHFDWKRLLLFSAMLVVIGGATALLAFLFFDVSPTKLLAIVIFSAIMFVVGVLCLRFEIVDRGVQRFFSAWLWFCLWGFVSLVPLTLFRLLSEYILTNFSLPFQIVAFAAWGLLLAGTLLLIATESNRDRLFEVLQKVGGLAPVIYSINVLMMAVIFFSAVTYVMASHGIVTLSSRTGQLVTLASLLDFYVWHFLEAVPLLKVNQTIRWDEPWTYDSAAVGWILLLFKLVVIVPVIGAFIGYWKRQTGPART